MEREFALCPQLQKVRLDLGEVETMSAPCLALLFPPVRRVEKQEEERVLCLVLLEHLLSQSEGRWEWERESAYHHLPDLTAPYSQHIVPIFVTLMVTQLDLVWQGLTKHAEKQIN